MMDVQLIINDIVNPNFRETIAAEPPKRRNQAENRAYRRKCLLDAAIKTVARHDIAGATVARICAQAGASRGLLAHYFDGKEELLIAALTDWFDTSLAIKKRIAAGHGSTDCQDPARDTAEEKIRRIAYSSFSRPAYSWENAAAWQAFTNASRYDQAFAKPIRAAGRYSNAITEPLFRRAAVERGIAINARDAALGLSILDDGLWNSLATGKDRLTLKQARERCDAYIDGCLKPAAQNQPRK